MRTFAELHDSYCSRAARSGSSGLLAVDKLLVFHAARRPDEYQVHQHAARIACSDLRCWSLSGDPGAISDVEGLSNILELRAGPKGLVRRLENVSFKVYFATGGELEVECAALELCAELEGHYLEDFDGELEEDE